MRLAFFVSTILITIATFSFGQTTDLSRKRVKFHRNIPEFIKAENSNFIVNFYTLPAFTDRDIIGSDDEIGSPERLDYARWNGPDPKLFEEIKRLINERLAEMKLYPAAIYNLDTKKLLDPEFLEQHYDSIAALQSGFSIDLAVIWAHRNQAKEVKEAFMNNTLSLDDIKIMSLSIMPIQERQPERVYAVGSLSFSAGKAFDLMHNDIREKPDEFFVQEMDINADLYTSGVFNQEAHEKQYTENALLSVFPEKSSIDDAEVLVLLKREFRRGETKDALRYLKRILPNEYHVVDQLTLPIALEDDYDYLIMPQYELVERRVQEYVGDPAIETVKERRYWYVIKDLKTLDLYHGMPIEDRQDRNGYDPSIALRKLLVDMRKHYDW